MGALRHPDADKLRLLAGLPSGKALDMDGGSPWKVEVVLPENEEQSMGKEISYESWEDPELTKQLLIQMDFSYPYEKAVRIPTKLSVSQVVKEGPGHRFLRRPSFLRHDELTPAQKGNAIHKFMQFADSKAASRSPEEEIARLVERQFISPQEAQWVSPQKVSSFFESGIGKRMLASPRLLREYRFLGEVSAEIAGGEPGEEPISIQGVMDCLFFEGEEMVIVDYKTDRVKGPEELVARYAGQLALYEEIAQKALGHPVKEKILYSFHLDGEIRV